MLPHPCSTCHEGACRNLLVFGWLPEAFLGPSVGVTAASAGHPTLASGLLGSGKFAPPHTPQPTCIKGLVVLDCILALDSEKIRECWHGSQLGTKEPSVFIKPSMYGTAAHSQLQDMIPHRTARALEPL